MEATFGEIKQQREAHPCIIHGRDGSSHKGLEGAINLYNMIMLKNPVSRSRFLKSCSLPFVGVFCQHLTIAEDFILQDDVTLKVDFAGVVSDLIGRVKSKEVGTVEILHISNEQIFRVSVSSDFLRKNPDCRLNYNHPLKQKSVIELIEILKGLATRALGHPADLRWGVLVS